MFKMDECKVVEIKKSLKNIKNSRYIWDTRFPEVVKVFVEFETVSGCGCKGWKKINKYRGYKAITIKTGIWDFFLIKEWMFSYCLVTPHKASDDPSGSRYNACDGSFKSNKFSCPVIGWADSRPGIYTSFGIMDSDPANKSRAWQIRQLIQHYKPNAWMETYLSPRNIQGKSSVAVGVI